MHVHAKLPFSISESKPAAVQTLKNEASRTSQPKPINSLKHLVMTNKSPDFIVRRMIFFPLFLICFIAGMTFTDCTPVGGFHLNDVTIGKPSWVPTTIPDVQYKTKLIFTFNRAVRQASLSAPGTVIINVTGTRDGRTVTEIAGTFHPNGAWGTAAEVAFVSDQTLDDLLDPGPGAGENLKFSITVLGTDAGNGVLRDTSGDILDGDEDGNPGGNYVKEFELVT